MSGRERLRAALDDYDQLTPGLRDRLARAIAELPGPDVPANASLLRSLWAIPSWRRVARLRRGAIELLTPPPTLRDERRAIAELVKAAAADARASATAALLRSWRGLHRFFALVMLAAVFLHAGVAWYYGYRWIFS